MLGVEVSCFPQLLPSPSNQHSFRNFIHPNIVKVLGVCLDNDPIYIIMELMPAGDLLAFLRDAQRIHVSIMQSGIAIYYETVSVVIVNLCVHT